VIDLTLDMRRHAVLQRTVDESKLYQDALNRLIECIRDGSSPRFKNLLEYVRGGASNQDVIDALQNSPTTLEDDSENHSPLQYHIKESQSPRNLQTQSSAHLPALDKVKHKSGTDFANGEVSLPSDLGKEKQPALNISYLVSQLKLLPRAKGERLLGQILAEYSSGKQNEVGYAAAQRLHDDFNRDAAIPFFAERSTWHPALQLRSQRIESEEERQVCIYCSDPISPDWTSGCAHKVCTHFQHAKDLSLHDSGV